MKSLASKTTTSWLSTAIRWTVPTLSLLLLTGLTSARAHADDDDDRQPMVPANLQVPAGNKLEFRARGVGVQIYAWSAATSSWLFQAPSAVLFHEEAGVVGIHYAGPTWQGTDGSKVVGKRLASATVDPNSIPWLLLQASSNTGPGVFAHVTYIQRLHTRGGLAPAAHGAFDGQQALVPYTADYLFYTAE